MAKKAKWLEESTDKELLDIVAKVLEGDEMSKKELTRIKKAVAELIERTPDENGEEGITVLEALEAAKQSLDAISAAYQAELDAMEDEEEEEEDSDEEEEEEDSDEEEEDSDEEEEKEDSDEEDSDEEEEEEDSDEEEEEEDSDEEEEEVDYTDWTIKDLKGECRARGIKVTKGMKKSDLIKALEADDEE